MHLPSSFLFVLLLCFSELASCFSHSFKLHRKEVDPVTIVDIEVLAARRDAVEHKYAPENTLQKRDSRSSSEVLVDLIELEEESIALSRKYGGNVWLEKRAAAVKSVPLIDVIQKTGYSVDLLYQVEVSIGTPPQPMLLRMERTLYRHQLTLQRSILVPLISGWPRRSAVLATLPLMYFSKRHAHHHLRLSNLLRRLYTLPVAFHATKRVTLYRSPASECKIRLLESALISLMFCILPV